MKKLILSSISLFFLGSLIAGTLVIEGKYQNKNLYVQNYFGGSGVGFCAKEVKVNGRITTDEVNSSAFEIDLAALRLKYGENVTIEIVHKDGCIPKILNMEDLKPKPTFEVLTMNITSSGVLKWTSKNENGALPYVIEQFKWNKWVPIGEVSGYGTAEPHDYSFQVVTHSGENKYRVKQTGLGSEPRYSNSVTLNSMGEKPRYEISKENDMIKFTIDSAFEMYDSYGFVVKKGYGKEIIISNLDPGKYYLCYDNSIVEVKKKSN